MVETEVEGDIDAASTLLGVDVTGQAALSAGDFCRITVVNDVPDYAP